MMTPTEQGYEAHRQHATRWRNPYLMQAKAWDDGWCKRQKEELNKSGNTDKANRVQNFGKFILGSIREKASYSRL